MNRLLYGPLAAYEISYPQEYVIHSPNNKALISSKALNRITGWAQTTTCTAWTSAWVPGPVSEPLISR